MIIVLSSQAISCAAAALAQQLKHLGRASMACWSKKDTSVVRVENTRELIFLKLSIASESTPFQKESSLPTTILQHFSGAILVLRSVAQSMTDWLYCTPKWLASVDLDFFEFQVWSPLIQVRYTWWWYPWNHHEFFFWAQNQRSKPNFFDLCHILLKDVWHFASFHPHTHKHTKRFAVYSNRDRKQINIELHYLSRLLIDFCLGLQTTGECFVAHNSAVNCSMKI